MTGKITRRLLDAGWQRINLPARAIDQCGSVSNAATGTGWCTHPARWRKLVVTRSALCADHALRAEVAYQLTRGRPS